MKKKEHIRKLLLEGKSYAEIRTQTGAAKSTIHYHAKALGNPNRADYEPQLDLAREMIRAGVSNRDISGQTSLSISTICQLRRQLDLPSISYWPDRDWEEVQDFYDQGNSITDCVERFSISRGSISNAVSQGRFKSRPRVEPVPLSEVLVENSSYARVHLKRRLLADGILDNVCAICCALPVWNGSPLILVLDHINGVNNDNRIENLRLICPNCNSQTDTFAGRNAKKSN